MHTASFCGPQPLKGYAGTFPPPCFSSLLLHSLKHCNLRFIKRFCSLGAISFYSIHAQWLKLVEIREMKASNFLVMHFISYTNIFWNFPQKKRPVMLLINVQDYTTKGRTKKKLSQRGKEFQKSIEIKTRVWTSKMEKRGSLHFANCN